MAAPTPSAIPQQPAPDLTNAANTMSSSFDSLGNAWKNAKASALEAKRWVETQLDWVDKNDEKLHKFVLAFIAVEFIWMGGPVTLAFFAIGYAAEAMYSEKIQEALERVKTVWLKTRTMQFAVFALGMLALPAYRWHFVAAIFGGYMSHYTTPKQNLDESDFVKVESETTANAESKDSKEAQASTTPRPYTWLHIKYWPIWPNVFPRLFQNTAPQTDKTQ